MFYLHLPLTLETLSWDLTEAIDSEQAVNPDDVPIVNMIKQQWRANMT